MMYRLVGQSFYLQLTALDNVSLYQGLFDLLEDVHFGLLASNSRCFLKVFKSVFKRLLENALNCLVDLLLYLAFVTELSVNNLKSFFSVSLLQCLILDYKIDPILFILNFTLKIKIL